MNVKGVTICFPEEILDKISYIADYMGRSVNSCILVPVCQDIAKFEETHGRITEELSPDINAKPSRKSIHHYIDRSRDDSLTATVPFVFVIPSPLTLLIPFHRFR